MAGRLSAEQYQAAHRAAVAEVKRRVEAYVTAAWNGLGSWRSADIDRFVAQVVPVVLAGQSQAAALTDAYLAAVATATLGTPSRVTGVKAAQVSGAAVRNGVSPQDVYRRAGITVWTALSRDVALDEAVRLGLKRAVTAAVTDVQLAVTHTAQLVLGADARVTGYRRVLNGTCALCLSESNRTYSKGELLPMHPGCKCSVMPEYSGKSSPKPKKVEGETVDVAEREHGELGPVLTDSSHKFSRP